MASADALLERPGSLHVSFEHIRTVIGFDHHHIGFPQMLMDVLRCMSEIGEPSETATGRDHVIFMTSAEPKSHWVLGVVRHGKTGDLQIAKLEGSTRFENLPIRAMAQARLHGPGGGGIGKNPDMGEFLQSLNGSSMIAVFVGEKYGINPVQVMIRAFEELAQFTGGKSCIDQNMRFSRLEQGAITRTSATQNAKTQ